MGWLTCNDTYAPNVNATQCRNENEKGNYNGLK